MSRQKQQFEKLVRHTCKQALDSCRERPELLYDNNSGIHVTLRMLQETAPQCGYDKEMFTNLVAPELRRCLD